MTVRAIVDASGKDPSTVLAEIMNDPDRDPRLRAHCAGELMKYLYPTLRAIEVTGASGGPIEGRTVLEVVYEDKSIPE